MSTGDGIAIPSTPSRSGSSAVLSTLGTPKSRHDKSPVSTPERPRKRIKLEEKPAANKEIEEIRHSVYTSKLRAIQTHKNVYRENLLELFFLQNMGNIMDYFIWRKKPDVKVYQFLKSGQVDSDDDEWYSERSVLSEGLAISGSIVSLSQSTSSATSLFSTQGLASGAIPSSGAFLFPGEDGNVSQTPKTPSSDSTVSGASIKTEPLSSNATTEAGISSILSSAVKSPVVSHLNTGSSSAVPESITGTQEAIVERAKQEAAVMQRVSELRRDGMWSSRRLPKVQEPPRGKAHWDYLLEEMQWLAADFAQERKWKKAGARKIASMISKYHKERQMKEIRAEKDEANRTRKIASNLAKMVREFWGNIEKIVEYKYQSRMEEKRKKAMDLHLSFIVDQTEKYSTWLTEGLATGTPEPSSGGGSPTRSAGSDDRDFEPSDSDEDDEETIRIEEMEAENDEGTSEELAELQKEMELPIEELLHSLPQEVLDKPASIAESDSDMDDSPVTKKRKLEEQEFCSSDEDSEDDEETLDQEEQEVQENTQEEISDLQQEGEMSIEDLRKKYAGAYDSDFEMPEDSAPETTDEEDSSTDESTEEEVEEECESEKDEDVGMEYLMKDLGTSKSPVKKEKDTEPGSELTDIAATAESIQPTGYTLETTKVRTEIPFLLKHTLREYQVVGLDWMATMYDRRLNGILADEMGLGKTIQTIALLAHLACEKGVWGPHLIVVPTSVMLNWEMEIKKWCPAFKILTYFGTQKERKAKRTGWTKTNAFHVCITSYKLVIQDHQAFRRKKWKYFILDEAQNIKNFKSQRWQTLLNFMSQRRLLLTGTPLQNSLMELWSLMHFLMPHVFQSHKDFKEWFANPLTGMIEGSREYNESLIKRLHKVLRPFLLRRLKSDVEKQMPKKYEHIVRCHLSRRQRFLYDDFMSQTKTKETLASGHYMSVINILMQLRKVCNHPNLFDARPILSPFQMEGITYTTASIVTKALEKDPVEYISPTAFHPSLVDLELCLPAFVAHRIRLLQTPRKLIEEIDNQPEPPARPPPAERPIKLLLRSTSPMPQASGRASPFVPIQQRSGSPMSLKSPLSKSPAVTPSPVTTPSVEATQLHHLPGHTPQLKTSHPTTSTPTSVTLSSASGSTSSATSQPITVQIQNTPQGTRLMIPSGQLSQLPGYIQIVQTSSGQQIIATSQPPPNQSSATTVVNGPGSSAFTMAGQSVKTTSSVQLPVTTSVVSSKPVMKVSPLVNTTELSSGVGSRVTSPLSPKSVISTRAATKTLPFKAKEKSVFFMESMHEKRTLQRRNKLLHIVKCNQHNCDFKPVYGLDLRDAVNVLQETKNPVNSQWQGLGYVHCHKVHNCGNPHQPSVFWRQTEALRSMLHTPEQYLQELHEILDRFTFVVPTVRSPCIRMRTFHPSPSALQAEKCLPETLHRDLAPRALCLHKQVASMSVQFPEVRLIQYDCGKLQTLDILLRQLKSGDHRVLIFTQMTKMLDVLEAFLNFHGHRYLRLDGTTKVEQRQALMERFNADRRIFVFILSTRSGGLGVNLTGADTVIFYDSDWNPTMDAQAQDRCHRIGQTRDVHIYRLISEKTIEENILKKANQKRLLSDVTIEGGNFTTAFFKENTIRELFEEPSGLEAFVKDKNEADAKAAAVKQRIPSKDSVHKSSKSRESTHSSLVEESVRELTQSRPPSRASSKASSMDQDHLEQVLCTAEDEGDVQAAKTAKAEQSAELAEFDEDIPWDEKEAEQKQQRDNEMSRVEQELSMLEKELTPVERYAVCHMEVQLAPNKMDELEKAEEDVSLAKEEWELSRLKALKEEEERRAELEEDEMLFTYSREDAQNQMYVCDETGEQMPMWAPPTPPQDDHDVYVDTSLYFLYEQSVMPETQLPPVYVKKEHKRVRVDPAVVTRKNKTRKEEQARVPKSLFDRPTSLLRRDTKLKLKQSFGLKPLATRPTLTRPLVDTGPEHPEWLIHEDWALLQAVQNLLELPLALSTSSPGHIPNWDLVADIVNTTSRTYRSAKQCRSRYENVIVPREEGRILYDVNPRKQKKTKSIYKVYHTKNNRPMRTSQLYAQDNNQSLSTLFTLRFDSSKNIASKRTPTLRPTLANPTLKNPKHAAVLGENGINYEQPLTPIDVAQIRADRIAKEKKEQQLAGQKSQASTASTTTTVVSAAVTQTATVVTQAIGGQPQLTVVQGHQHLQAVATAAGTTIVPAASLQKTATVSAASVSLPKGLAAASVVNTAGAVPANALATINRKFGQTVVGSLTQNVVTTAMLATSALSQGVRVAPSRTYVQEISAAIAQARTTTGTLITTMSQAQLPRVTLTASTVAPAKGTAQAQITTNPKLTQHHLRILQQKQQQYKQQQQRTNLSALQTTQSAIVQAVRPTAVATVTTPLITSISGTAATRLQVPKQTLTQQTKPRAMTEAEMAVLLRHQQKAGAQKIQTLSGASQLTTGQILTGGQQVQSQAGAAGVATLVKTVSTQGSGANLPSVTIPVSAVGLGITVPQKQGNRTAQMQVRQLVNPKGRAMPAAQLQTHKATLSQIQVPKAGSSIGTPLIIPQKHANQQVIVQQIQQIVKQQSQSSQPQTVQQLITAASSNAATVLVTQAGQPVARLSVPTVTTTVQARSTAPPNATAQQTLLNQPASSSTVSLQPASLVKNLQEVVVSPAKSGVGQQLKTLPVSTATLRNISGLTLAPSQTGAVNIQQIQQQAKQAHTPSPGVQQAVQQVVQQAQAQAQQRHLHSSSLPTVVSSPPANSQNTGSPAATQQSVAIQQSTTPQSTAVQHVAQTTDQKAPYSTRLRTTKQ